MLNSQEFLYLVLIELGILMLAAIGFVIWRWRRKRKAAGSDPAILDLGGEVPEEDALTTYLQSEIRKTTEKLEQVGTNSPQATLLHEACEFRLRVLQGELDVLQSAEDEKQYWAQIADYFDSINRKFNARLHALQAQIDAYLEKIENLQTFASGLKEKLGKSKESIGQLEQALAAQLGDEAISEELKTLMDQLEQDKKTLESQLEMAESEVSAMMENVELLREQAKSGNNDAVAEDTASEAETMDELALLKEENEFLCNQIAMLLKEELSHNEEVTGLREEHSQKLETMEAENRVLKEKLDQAS